MENTTIQRIHISSSQKKALDNLRGMWSLEEETFKQKLSAFLKERFTYWLDLGKKNAANGRV